jgi:hypothetical protein
MSKAELDQYISTLIEQETVTAEKGELVIERYNGK